MTLVHAETGEIVLTLEDHEYRIARGLDTFIEVGESLGAIRDGRMYKKSGYSDFDTYCERRWGFGRNFADKQIRAAEAVAELGTNVPSPRTESQARPLTKLPTPEAKREAWEQAQADAEAEGTPVAARHVEHAVKRHQEPTWADVVARYPIAADVPTVKREGIRRAFVQLTTSGPEFFAEREPMFINAIETDLLTPEQLAARRANAIPYNPNQQSSHCPHCGQEMP